MGFVEMIFQDIVLAMAIFLLFVMWRLLHSCWIKPNRFYRKLRKNGLYGPTPRFPLGNIKDMNKKEEKENTNSFSSSLAISHDIHSSVFPYFANWQKSHGKVFIYWLGTEPFLYISDPEFLKRMSAGIAGKSWGKANVFKRDREPMFGNGLVMAEGDSWVHHRHVITPAFFPPNLRPMATLMVESTTNMLYRWASLVASGKAEIDVESEITRTAGEIIAKTSFGMRYNGNGREVFDKLRALQITLFRSNRYVGVPFSKFMRLKQNLKAKKLGKEIDSLLLSVVNERKKSIEKGGAEKDLLGLLLSSKETQVESGRTALTTKELVDECKTFFFGGHETTALALTWTLMLLAEHPEWQTQLREEIADVVGEGEIDVAMLVGLKKMGWVMNEVLRLYAVAPNVQRQLRRDIRMDEKIVIPNGTNVWIDIVAMHHDKALWGEDVHEFKPERFKDDLYGGCSHKMGFLPFGFGGRMCVGRNLSMMEYKVVLTLILTRFSLSLSPNYSHSPSILLSLRPSHGLPLILRPL